MIGIYCPVCKLPLDWNPELHCESCGTGPIDPVIAERVPLEDRVRGLLLALPADFQGVLFSYLGLFRTRRKDKIMPLQPRTVCRLLEEILSMLKSGQLAPAPAAEAMLTMLSLDLDLPMKNHNYLLKMAATASEKNEKSSAAVDLVVDRMVEKYRASYRASSPFED